jgi:hypothetical protein
MHRSGALIGSRVFFGVAHYMLAMARATHIHTLANGLLGSYAEIKCCILRVPN